MNSPPTLACKISHYASKLNLRCSLMAPINQANLLYFNLYISKSKHQFLNEKHKGIKHESSKEDTVI